MALKARSIDKEFLQQFMLQLSLAASKKEKTEKAKMPMPEKLPFVRPYAIVPKRATPRFPSPFIAPKAEKKRAEIKKEAGIKLPEEPIEKPKEEAAGISKEKMNFGKLAVYIENPAVSYIECPGANQKLKIIKEGIMSEADVSLNQQEMDEIIKKFAEKAKVPTSDIFSASIDGLTISVINSVFLGCRFVIIKNQ